MMLPSDKFTAAFHSAESEAPKTLVERAYLSLRRDIVIGEFQPGERLRVEHLKDRYDVGAGTLREALALLVSDALVRAEGQRGFRVTGMSLVDLEDLTLTRVLVETEALRQSIRRGDAQWEQNLRQAYQHMYEVETRPGGMDPLERETANKLFHEALIAAYCSPWSKYLLGILYRQSERYRHVAVRLGTSPNFQHEVHQEHAQIYGAAIKRREARAALALEAHIWRTYDSLSASHQDSWTQARTEASTSSVRLQTSLAS